MKSLFFILIILSVSCGNYTDLKTEPDQTSISALPLEALNFENIKTSVLNESCLQCHKAYENYNAVKGDIDKILAQIGSDQMPLNMAPLKDEQKNLLRAWKLAGTPFDSDDTDSTPTEPELEPLWESVSVKIIFPKCVSCHNPNGQASFLDLSTRQSFFDNRDYLLNNFEDVENSYLIEVITDPDEPMPPKWSSFEQLNEKEISTLIEWIQKGLP